MRKLHLLIILLNLSLSTEINAQINYEHGYFIDNSGIRTNCLIKNLDWKNNPVKFDYKLTEEAKPVEATINEVSEFATNFIKFQRHQVDIDTSGTQTSDLDTIKEPKFKRRTLFLKVLVEGVATLYSYEEGEFKSFFFKVGNDSVVQLVYKKYYKKENFLAKNDQFKKQLWAKMWCVDISAGFVEALSYDTKGLINFFKKYYRCVGGEFSVPRHKEGGRFNLEIKVGVGSSYINLDGPFEWRDVSFDSKITPRFGLGMELVLPFNRNKWSITVEPMFQHYKDSKEVNTRVATLKYTSVEVPIGGRHYFFLTERSKIYLSGAMVLDFPVNSSVVYSQNAGDFALITEVNFTAGIGYYYRNRFALELRYYTPRDVMDGYSGWNSIYHSIYAGLNYRLF